MTRPRNLLLRNIALFTAVIAPHSLPAAMNEPFFWGVANSAFQVEGHPLDSDWKRFTRTPGRIGDGTDADAATDFWNRFEEDFSLARQAGLNAFRISIAWERVEPREGVWDEGAIAHYARIISSIRRHGMEPFVTLNHFVLPGWIVDKGGLLAEDFPALFTRYAEKVAPILSSGEARVRYWLTFNEPELQASLGYEDGKWPPGLRRSKKGVHALANLAKAHISAVSSLRKRVPPGTKFSFAKNWRVFEPKRPRHPLDRLAVKVADHYSNFAFAKALMTGKIDFRFPEGGHAEERVRLPDRKPTLDFIGINYYSRTLLEVNPYPPFLKAEDGDGPKTDLGWEVYPDGIRLAAEKCYRTLGLPILFTENGLADHRDGLRPEFLAAHIDALKKASLSGVPVMGYLHWSLTDNFEWADGLTPRFGLIEIDYGTGERIPRPSFWEYARLIRE